MLQQHGGLPAWQRCSVASWLARPRPHWLAGWLAGSIGTCTRLCISPQPTSARGWGGNTGPMLPAQAPGTDRVLTWSLRVLGAPRCSTTPCGITCL